MNWKEQFDQLYPHPFLPVTSIDRAKTISIQQDALDEYYRLLQPSVKDFISKEIIEKIIEDIPPHLGFDSEDETWKEIQEELRTKWLREEKV